MRFIELFAGVGGFRVGLETAGHTCIWASEIDKFAIKTYQANFGDRPHGDITRLAVKQTIPEHDLLTAGFPCPDFTLAARIAGGRPGLVGVRGRLFYEVIRVLQNKQPPWFLLENVPGILTANKGSDWAQIQEQLRAAGYGIWWRRILTADFGPPQKRERIYIVGRRGANLFQQFRWPDLTHPVHKPLRWILEPEVDEKYYLTPHQLERAKRTKNRTKGGEMGKIPLYADLDGLSRVLTQDRSKGDRALMIIKDPHTGRARRLTPREEFRAHGFSDNFKLPCSDHQTYNQAANAVSPPVITAIARGFKQLDPPNLQRDAREDNDPSFSYK